MAQSTPAVAGPWTIPLLDHLGITKLYDSIGNGMGGIPPSALVPLSRKPHSIHLLLR